MAPKDKDNDIGNDNASSTAQGLNNVPQLNNAGLEVILEHLMIVQMQRQFIEQAT